MDLEHLSGFNRKFNKNAILVNRHDLWPDVDGFNIHFYELIKDIDPSQGCIIVKLVGGFNGGEFYESFRKEEFGFYICEIENLITNKAYPISEKETLLKSLTIGYKSSTFDKYAFLIGHSTISFKRFWIEDFNEIVKMCPEKANKISSFLNTEISQLAKIQNQSNYKSGWVYYQYSKNCNRLSDRINGDILKDTKFFFHPMIYYNSVSPHIVQLSKQEIQEDLDV